jgi:carbamoylphosphate synthase large subunit
MYICLLFHFNQPIGYRCRVVNNLYLEKHDINSLLANTKAVERTTDKERAKQLLAEDFQYQLTTPDGTMLFKKAK